MFTVRRRIDLTEDPHARLKNKIPLHTVQPQLFGSFAGPTLIRIIDLAGFASYAHHNSAASLYLLQCTCIYSSTGLIMTQTVVFYLFIIMKKEISNFVYF